MNQSSDIDMTSKVSIILPVYNGEMYIARTIDSIIEQNYNNFELIVINNNSMDNTLNIINEYTKMDNRILCINSENTLNMAENWNNWMKYGDGLYTSMIHADDYYHQNFLSECVKYMESNNYDYIVTDANLVDENENVFQILNYYKNNFDKQLTYEKFPGIQRQFWKRKNLVKKFQSQYFQIFDYIWYVENSKDFKVGYLNKPLVYIRVHQEQITNKVNWINGILKTIISVYVNKIDFNKNYKKTILNHLIKALKTHTKLRIKALLAKKND